VDCLTENQLLDYASGTLEAAQARAVDEHVDGCPSCRALLAGWLEAEQGDPGDRTEEPTEGQASLRREGEGATVLSELPSPEDDLPRGTAVDRYVLLKRVGTGGMGIVYAAYDPRLDRTIAVKMVRSDVAARMSEEVRSRMLREAQAMARLSHPNVATVYDAGTYQGRLYVAIEYLDEGSLADWLARGGHTWRQVVDVFLQAGAGLAVAHQHGLVHRDFKPQNVLVAKDGRVRITDFGLVRPAGPAVQPDDLTRPAMERLAPAAAPPPDPVALDVPLTRSGALVGTPRYMAPEQLAGGEVDARADQFSFCVSLYEALYARWPFEARTIEELRRAIHERRLTRPAPARRVPEWLRRALLKGLSPAPADRFPSMEALLQVLSGHRHRPRWPAVAATSAAVMAAALLAAAGVAGVGAIRARACRDSPGRLEAVWGAARGQAVQAAFERSGAPFATQAFQHVAAALDTYAAAWSATRAEACEATRRRGEQPESVLSLRMACLDRRLEEMDALVRLLAAADAEVVRQSAPAVNGLRPLGRCLDRVGLIAEAAAPAAPALAEKLREVHLGLADARAFLAAGRYAQAGDQARAAVEAARASGDRSALGEALGLLGAVELRSGDPVSAARTLLEAELLAEEAGQDDLATDVSTLLSAAYQAQARLADAQIWVAHGESVLRRMPGDDVLEAGILEQKARLLGAAGRWREAVAPLRQAVELKARALGPRHPDVAEALLSLAREMKGPTEYDEALATARRALDILERAYGPDHPETARAWKALGQIHRDRGEFWEELIYARRFLALQERLAGPESLDVAGGRWSLATALSNLGQFEEALAEYQAALSVFQATYREVGDRQLQIASLMGNVAGMRYQLGEDAQALRAAEEALQIHLRVAGPEDPKLVHPLYGVGLALSALGRGAEADGYFQRAYAAAQRLGEDNGDLSYAYRAEGTALYERGRSQPARDRLALALQKRAMSAPAGSAVLALVEAELARAELALGHAADAQARADRAIEALAPVVGPEQRPLALALAVAGEARRRRGDAAGALPWLERAVALCERHRYRPLLEGEARLWLAMALRDGRREPARATALALAAQAQLTAARAGARAAQAAAVAAPAAPTR
jgi:tetratricopeptide (TPR) repeat protein